jgi:hypothetical protein
VRYDPGVIRVGLRSSSSRASRGLAVGLAGLSLAFGASCANDASSPGSVNAPCTRTPDCVSGLSCQSGVCTSPLDDAGNDSQSDAEIKDAPNDG